MKKKENKTSSAKSSKGTKAAVEPIEDVEWYRVKLEEMRDNLLRTVKKKKEEAIPESEVGDEGDVAMRSLARDLIFEQTDNEHRLLDDVEAALRRIEKNVYGICEGNGERITVARLKAIPYARYCINCQSRFERQ
ncbi:MAG: RNA polymerase-binding transcription factor DksA [Elusimicrobia bacterium]|nr:RNA polymerase-binding transcription factor DksA [Elusimicrobiota bacterium]